MVLLHLRQKRRVGLCGLYIDRIYFGLRSPGGYLRLFKGYHEVIFKVTPRFVESLFAGPLPEPILIELAFLNVCKRHIDSLGGRTRVLDRDRFLVPFNFLNTFFEKGFAQNWFLHPPINSLDIFIFQFRVIGDKASQDL